MSVQELQGVILAGGRGSSMSELINPSIIKCLLPICGNPLIYYTIKFLSQNGFQDILIIVQDREKDEIKRIVEKIGDKLCINNIELFSIPEDSDEFGTCHSLQLAYINKKINRDILLISCDTIINFSLLKLLNFHRTYDSDCTILFLSNLPGLSSGKIPGPKCSIQLDHDIIGIEPNTTRLVFLGTEADLDENICLPLTTLKKCSYFKLITWLKDCHIYLIRKRVLDLHFNAHNNNNNTIKHTSVKGDFIPFLINSQFNDETATTTTTTGPGPSSTSTATSSTTDINKLSLYGFIDSEKHCIRINTILNYATICKSLNWLYKTFDIEINPNTAGAGQKLSTNNISTNVKLKATIIGDSCVLKDGVKLTNTILMDNIEIDEGAILDNCIISSGAKIGSKCILKECLVGPKHIVPEGSQFTNEYLSASDESFF